ncbi:MerR family transcriptional regulator [Stackebrandtia soli]|uniref:MerR family transcriptional regulator n=1 Tax=Stackebrandtia soli TaxID=1892856 RepID=UPI0039EB5005
MRIAELSRVSGVSAPSIKYYLRTGLLPSGERTAVNQAEYGDRHLRRLRLIRALIDVGGLTIAATGEVLAAIDAETDDANAALDAAMHATFPHSPDEDDPEWGRARKLVAAVIARRGWRIAPDSHAASSLIAAIATMRRVSRRDITNLVEIYAEQLERLADREVAWALESTEVDEVVESAVVGTVIGGAVISAMRRVAHENAAAKLSRDRPGRPSHR